MKNLLFSVLIVLFLTGSFSNLSAFEMNKGEKGYIVLPAKPIPAEEHAARILQSYLGKMLKNTPFALVKENELPAGSKNVFYLGDTEKLRSIQKDLAHFGQEELLIRSNGNDLFLERAALDSCACLLL